jgi:copper chaperone CopZ
LNITSAVLLIIFLINGYMQKFINRKKMVSSKSVNEMTEKTVKVNGMTCNHCKANVENNLSSIEGITDIEIDLESGVVKVSGDDIDLIEVKNKVEGIGYAYEGEV